MKNKNKRTAMWTATICGCLCLVAVGAGVVWQALDYKEELPQTAQYQARENGISVGDLQPVTMAQTPTVKETKEQTKTEPTPEGQPVKKAEASEPVLAYPVQGEIVMPYSVDSAIYDPTLNQYRTSDSISISAAAGDAVQAAEKGKVQEITKDEEKGTSVVIEHDNGWLTTYSQLAEDVSVKTGETVEKGQVIGTVGEPTKYSVALGSHVQFGVSKDGETVDPEKTVKDK